jgi:hypothetical protein
MCANTNTAPAPLPNRTHKMMGIPVYPHIPSIPSYTSIPHKYTNTRASRQELLLRLQALRQRPVGALNELVGVNERFRGPYSVAVASLNLMDIMQLPCEKMQVCLVCMCVYVSVCVCVCAPNKA